MNKCAFVFAMFMTFSLISKAKIIIRGGDECTYSCSNIGTTGAENKCPEALLIDDTLSEGAKDCAMDNAKDKCKLKGGVLGHTEIIGKPECSSYSTKSGKYHDCTVKLKVECELSNQKSD